MKAGQQVKSRLLVARKASESVQGCVLGSRHSGHPVYSSESQDAVELRGDRQRDGDKSRKALHEEGHGPAECRPDLRRRRARLSRVSAVVERTHESRHRGAGLTGSCVAASPGVGCRASTRPQRGRRGAGSGGPRPRRSSRPHQSRNRTRGPMRRPAPSPGCNHRDHDRSHAVHVAPSIRVRSVGSN